MSLGVFLQCKDEVHDLKHQTTIGRAPTNLIQIPENTVSKVHARMIILKDNQTFLTDLNSINGTYVNGEKIEPDQKVALKHNDSVQFGRSMF